MKNFFFTMAALLLITGSLLISAFINPAVPTKEEALEKFSKEVFATLQRCDIAAFSKMILTEEEMTVVIQKSTLPDSTKKDFINMQGDKTKDRQQEVMNSYLELCGNRQNIDLKNLLWDDFDYSIERKGGIYSAKAEAWLKSEGVDYRLRLRGLVWVEGTGWKLAEAVRCSKYGQRYPSFRPNPYDYNRQLLDSMILADSIARIYMYQQMIADSTAAADYHYYVQDSIAKAQQGGKKRRKKG